MSSLSCAAPRMQKRFLVQRQFRCCSRNMLALSFWFGLHSPQLRWGRRKSRRRCGCLSPAAFCGRFAPDVSTANDPRRGRKKKINFYVRAVAFKQTDCSFHKVKDWVSGGVFSPLLFLLDCLSDIGVIDTDMDERWNKVSYREQRGRRSNLQKEKDDTFCPKSLKSWHL